MSFGLVNTLESKVDRAGDTILGDIIINKDLIVHNTLTIDNNIIQTNTATILGNTKVHSFNPNNNTAIKFHNNNSKNPTSFIEEDIDGYLCLNKSPMMTDNSTKIVTTEWARKNPIPYAYNLVGEDNKPLNVGSGNNPVYFKNGIPVITDNTLNKDISGNAATAIYAVDAGHAVNADQANHSTTSNNSVRAISADIYNQLGSLKLKGLVSAQGNFNSNAQVNLSVSSGSEGIIPLPNWKGAFWVSIGPSNYTMTTDAYIYITCGMGTYAYINGYEIPLADGRDSSARVLLPVAKNNTVYINTWCSVLVVPIQ